MRIVSLLPAATEIVALLELAEYLVAITHECDYPAAAIRHAACVTSSHIPSGSPRVVDAAVRETFDRGEPLFAIDADAIAALQPDVILTQALCDVCAVSETDVRAIAARMPVSPMIVTLAGTTVDGVFQDIIAVANALGVSARGQAVVDQLQDRLDIVRAKVARAERAPIRTAVIEWTDPVFAAGHWAPEMVALAGGMDVLASPGEHSRIFTVAAVEAARPEALFFAPCGYDLTRAKDEASETLATTAWAWARGLPVWALDANAVTSRPGPRIVDGVEAMAEALYPEEMEFERDGVVTRVRARE